MSRHRLSQVLKAVFFGFSGLCAIFLTLSALIEGGNIFAAIAGGIAFGIVGMIVAAPLYIIALLIDRSSSKT